MRIIKCDLCKKKIKDELISVNYGFLKRAELCEKCAVPILKFLKKNKLIEIKPKKSISV